MMIMMMIIGNSEEGGGGGGGGVISIAQVFEIKYEVHGVGGSKRKNHPWGRYGYFLEPHIIIRLQLSY